jgi:LDH2 family malate/lactate/ureidoglycolate dehydrogenase
MEALSLAGVPKEDGGLVAGSLIKAELQGISSHGVTRFPVYLRRVQKGIVNPRPVIAVKSLYPAAISIDGDNGLGAVVMTRAVTEGIKAAEVFGIAMAGVKHSNHFGTAGYYCEMAAEQGYASMLVSNGPAALPPWGGKEAYFGTNPIAFGIPQSGRPHVIVDMATSIVARGKIIEAAKRGEPIPANWALDREGNPTTDARRAMDGVIMPMAGPKGYALSLAVEHFAGVLTGAGFGRDIAWQYSDREEAANVGHTMVVMRADAFETSKDYFERMKRFSQEIRSIALAPQFTQIKLPGEREWEAEQARLREGLAIPVSLAQELRAIGDELGLELI